VGGQIDTTKLHGALVSPYHSQTALARIVTNVMMMSLDSRLIGYAIVLESVVHTTQE